MSAGVLCPAVLVSFVWSPNKEARIVNPSSTTSAIPTHRPILASPSTGVRNTAWLPARCKWRTPAPLGRRRLCSDFKSETLLSLEDASSGFSCTPLGTYGETLFWLGGVIPIRCKRVARVAANSAAVGRCCGSRASVQVKHCCRSLINACQSASAWAASP